MNRRDRFRMLSEITRVRQLQERAAEMEVGRANSELHSLDAERSQAADRLSQAQENWEAAVGGGLFDPTLVKAWSATVVDRSESVSDVASRITQTSPMRLNS